MTYDASSRKDIRKAEKAADLESRLRTEFLKTAMAHSDGRAWFYALLSDCHVFDGTFIPDAMVLAFNTGLRNIGLRIFSDLQTSCPSEYLTMMREYHARRTSPERSSQPESGRDDTGSEPTTDLLPSAEPDGSSDADTTAELWHRGFVDYGNTH